MRSVRSRSSRSASSTSSATSSANASPLTASQASAWSRWAATWASTAARSPSSSASVSCARSMRRTNSSFDPAYCASGGATSWALVYLREQRGRLGGDAQRHYELEAEVSRRPLNALTSLLVLSRDAWKSPLVGFLAEEIVKGDRARSSCSTGC